MADLSNYNVPQDGHPVHLVDSPFGPLAVMFTDIGRISICSAAARSPEYATVNKIPVCFNIWARWDRVLGTDGGRRWSIELGYARRMDKPVDDNLTNNQRVKIYEWAREFVPAFAAEHRAVDERAVALKNIDNMIAHATEEVSRAKTKLHGLIDMKDALLRGAGLSAELAAKYTALTK